MLPLCPGIALISYDPPRKNHFINRYVEERSKMLGIRHVILSPFVAKFIGMPWSIRIFSEEYPNLLCAFEPQVESNDRETYLSCMSNVPKWISSVQSNKPESLMLEELYFKENCDLSH